MSRRCSIGLLIEYISRRVSYEINPYKPNNYNSLIVRKKMCVHQTEKTVQQIIQSPLVKTVYLLVKKGANIQLKNCQTLEIDSIQSSKMDVPASCTTCH